MGKEDIRTVSVSKMLHKHQRIKEEALRLDLMQGGPKKQRD